MLEQRLFNFYTFIVLETYNSVNVGYVFTVFSGGLVSLSGNKYFRISVQLQLLRFLSLNHFSHLDNARQCRATSWHLYDYFFKQKLLWHWMELPCYVDDNVSFDTF